MAAMLTTTASAIGAERPRAPAMERAAMGRLPHTTWEAVASELGPRFADRAAELDGTDGSVAEHYADLRARDVFAAAVPLELGGGGASIAELSDLLRTLAQYSGSTALALGMHTYLVAIAAWLWHHQNGMGEPLLRRVAEEQIVLVSIGGADWLEGSGRAERVPGGFRVSDRKPFGSGAPAGEVLMTTAVWEDPKIGRTVLYLPVSMHDRGVHILAPRQAMGMRGTDSHDIRLEDVFVPDEAILIRRAYGRWHPLMHVVTHLAAPLVHSVYVGLAEAARDLALRLAPNERDDPGLQSLAGQMENALVGTQLALREMVALAMTAQASAPTTNRMMICRTLVGEGALRTVDRAMDVVGRRGFYRESRLERIFRDVQAVRYHPLQEQRQERYAGRVALGLPIDRD